MKFIRVSVLISGLLVAIFCQAEPLKSASRFDISISPYKYGLQGELARALDDYRTGINQTGIQPSAERQMRAERDRIRLLVQSRGYYRAEIRSEFDEQAAKPKYKVQLGERFQILAVELQGNYTAADTDWLTIKVGDPLSAVDVIAQQSKFKSYIEENECYYDVSVSHEVRLDEARLGGQVTLIARVSDQSSFGPISFSGIGDIQEDFLHRVAGIEEGGCYRRADVDNAVIALFDTGLFSQVRPTIERQNDQVLVSFQVQKREKRTISASAGWETERGLGVGAGWQHRDLFGRAQSLTLQSNVTAFEQSLSAKIVIPSFFDRRNRFNWTNEIQHTDDDIETNAFASTASLERSASRRDYFEYGIGYRQINERVDDQWTTYRQIRLPLQYRFDSVTDPFNPQKGMRYRAQVEPVLDIQDDFTPFVKTALGFQNFFTSDNGLTLATRLRWGAIWYGEELGSSATNVPESELYSAGGSTSVRGYAYESIHVMTDDQVDTGVGGTQRWLMVNEFRSRLNDSWGLVSFWDVGKVGNQISDFNQGTWVSGIGAGFRFYTRFAPLRFDVAIPMTPREGDNRFMLYVSLGQSF